MGQRYYPRIYTPRWVTRDGGVLPDLFVLSCTALLLLRCPALRPIYLGTAGLTLLARPATLIGYLCVYPYRYE